MIYLRVLNCNLYKKNEIVLSYNYIYDKNLKPTNILIDDSTLKEIVSDHHIKTLQGHYLLLSNIRLLVTTEELRYVKLKRLMNG